MAVIRLCLVTLKGNLRGETRHLPGRIAFVGFAVPVPCRGDGGGEIRVPVPGRWVSGAFPGGLLPNGANSAKTAIMLSVMAPTIPHPQPI
jgi:ABC-type cobalamin transport system permease subunit